MKDLISVIVPVYKVEKYLRECIDSIINQTYTNLEIILVDDGSLDNCPQICDEYAVKDSRIKVLHLQNGGVSRARNKGLDTATGEYITFVDSDDYIDKRYVEKLYASSTNNIADLTFCKIEQFCDSKRNKMTEYALNELNDCKDCYNEFLNHIFTLTDFKENLIMCSACRILYKSKIINDNKLRFDEQIIFTEDRLFLLDCLKYCTKCSVVDEYLYYYRQVAESVTHKYIDNFYEIQMSIYEKTKKYIADTKILKILNFDTIECLFYYEIFNKKDSFPKNKINKIYKIMPYKDFNLRVYLLTVKERKKRYLSLLLFAKLRMIRLLWLFFKFKK